MSETMTNEWPAIMSDYLKAMSAIEQRFQSGNEIPVPDARITRAEWEALDRYSLEDEARSTDAGMAYMHLEEERDALRAELAAIKARIEGSRHAFLGPNMDRITFLADEIGPSGKYALVKVEE